MPETRTKPNVYQHEFTRDDHRRLLRIVRRLRAKVILCGYKSDLYGEMLDGWRRTDIRGRSFTELSSKGRKLPYRVLSLWTNYEPPSS